MNRSSSSPRELVGVMNDTKWEEFRLALYELGPLSPQFQIKDLESDEPGMWDDDWFFHFRLLPYSTIEWCDLRVRSDEQRLAVLECVRVIHVPGQSTTTGFRVYGWGRRGDAVNYIK